MKRERRPLITDRVAWLLTVVVFLVQLTPLSGRLLQRYGEYDGLIIYPLMQVAFRPVLHFILYAVVLYQVMRWLGAAYNKFVGTSNRATRLVAGVLTIIGVCAGLYWTLFSIFGWNVEGQHSIRVNERAYIATTLSWIRDSSDTVDVVILRCDRTGVFCRHVSTDRVWSSYPSSEYPELEKLIFDMDTNSVQLLYADEIIRSIELSESPR